MKNFTLSLLVLFVFSSSVFAQTDNAELKTVELLAPMNTEGKVNPANTFAACFNFTSEQISCKDNDLSFKGIILRKQYSDLFQAGGVGSRNRIKKLGRKNWTDDFKVPVVEPYAKLKDGEQRLIVWDTSGRDGRTAFSNASDRMPGANEYNDVGTVSGAGAIERRTSKTVKSDYHPFEEVVEGNMYVMRVVDETNDFYVLFRVDELEKGKSCKISWKKLTRR